MDMKLFRDNMGIAMALVRYWTLKVFLPPQCDISDDLLKMANLFRQFASSKHYLLIIRNFMTVLYLGKI